MQRRPNPVLIAVLTFAFVLVRNISHDCGDPPPIWVAIHDPWDPGPATTINAHLPPNYEAQDPKIMDNILGLPVDGARYMAWYWDYSL